MKLTSTFAIAALLLSAIGLTHAEIGVTDTEILLGQTAVLEGPASALGIGMKQGLDCVFNDINAAGGIEGRKITLLSLNDGYEPDQSILNTRSLINDEQVFLMIGGVGTPTAKVIVPICEEEGVPFVGAFTGAGLLRKEGLKQTINFRASYNQEMERLAKHLVDEKNLSKIACFYQNDAYGQAGLSGISIALEKRGLSLSGTGTYERNTVAVKTGLLEIRKAQPEAIIMVGAYKACAEFIKLAKKVGMKETVFCNISFVGTKALQAELGDSGEGVIISQVVPHPSSQKLPIVPEYLESLERNFPGSSPDWVSLEGYLAGKMFVEIAKNAGADLTRSTFLEAVTSHPTLDIGGVPLAFGPGDLQGSDLVFLTRLKGGEVVEVYSEGTASL